MESEFTDTNTSDPETDPGFPIFSIHNPRTRWILLIVLVIIVLFLLYGMMKNQSPQSDVPPDTQITTPSLSPISTLSLANPTVSPTPPMDIVRVSYRPAKRLPASVLLSDGPHSAELSLQSIGFVQEGRYKDWALVRSEQPYHRSKGGGGTSLQYLRFLLHYTSLVYLPLASDPENGLTFALKQQRSAGSTEPFPEDITKAFADAGYQLTVDERTTIPDLDYPSPISGPNGSQFIYTNEGEGIPDKTLLIEAFTQTDGAPIWTTKPGRGPTAFFYTGEEVSQAVTPAIGCRGTQCFMTNGFYRFRPDGTFTMYTYQLPFDPETIQWNDSRPGMEEARFTSATRIGCGPLHADVTSITPSDIVSSSDLVPIGTFNADSGTVYGIQNANHALLKQFYAAYSSEVPEWWRAQRLPDDSYEEFVAHTPMLFFRDPFDRLIRLTNARYVPPYACEPILYLYPEKPMDISVHLDPQVRMLASTPSYTDGWRINANPNGSIINLRDTQAYPYIFWEGYAGIIPPKNEGFVVAQKQIHKFFEDILPTLGLNEKESADFIAAWEPRFSDAPYYRVSFLFPEFLNEYAPLSIHPKPDTVIRIWIDYQPLPAFARIPAQQLPKTPIRQGFTVVEWGGLTR